MSRHSPGRRNISRKRQSLERDFSAGRRPRGRGTSSPLPSFFEKLKEAILFICWYAREMPLGSIRLNKIIFNADRRSYSSTLKPIIADAYARGPQGPYLKELRLAVASLVEERKISVKRKYVGKHMTRVYRVDREPEIRLLASEEIECLKQLAETICLDYSARDISEASHNSVWKMAKDQERIPLAAQLVANTVQPAKRIIEWACEDE